MPAPDRPPSFPLYPRDFLGDKNVIAMESMPWPHGFVAAWGYTRLWLRSWEEPEPGVLPDDDMVLASLAGISPTRWPRYREAIARCFDTTSRPGYWVQKRVVRERQLQMERRNSYQKWGKEGALKSAQKRNMAGHPEATPKPPSGHPQATLKPPSSRGGSAPPGSAPPGSAPPGSPLAFASASAREEKDFPVPRTELSAERPGDVPAGTAGSQATRGTEPGALTPVGEVLRSVLPARGGASARTTAPKIRTHGGEDASDPAAVQREVERQRRALADAADATGEAV